ncbi:hypothetical protein ACFLQI_01615 [Candidatus Undinarchaeota archaeon]
MIKGGTGGGKTNVNGLRFEKRVSLRSVLEAIPEYSVKEHSVYFDDKKVAELYPKHDIYKKLLEPSKIDYMTLISKKLLPDDAILILKNKTMYIIEIKFQEVSGSVDEKLQTCDFKKKQYQKLLAPLNIEVEYIYVLNDWFKNEKYAHVLEYVKSVGCKYFFYEIPLTELGLPKPPRNNAPLK